MNSEASKAFITFPFSPPPTPKLAATMPVFSASTEDRIRCLTDEAMLTAGFIILDVFLKKKLFNPVLKFS